MQVQFYAFIGFLAISDFKGAQFFFRQVSSYETQNPYTMTLLFENENTGVEESYRNLILTSLASPNPFRSCLDEVLIQYGIIKDIVL